MSDGYWEMERGDLIRELRAAEADLAAARAEREVFEQAHKDAAARSGNNYQRAVAAESALEAAAADLAAAMEALRELIACHDILNAGLVSFELHNETVERFEAAMAKGRELR